LRLLLIEDDLAYSLGIETFLGRLPFVKEVFPATDGERGLELLALNPVDAVILDIGLPGLGGLEVCRRIVDRFGQPVLVLTSQDDPSWVGRLWEAGASGYLHKAEALLHLEVAIQSVLQGASWWGPSATRALRAMLDLSSDSLDDESATSLPPLTPREKDVLQGLAGGLTNQQIADKLGIGAGTVRIYVQTLFQKLEVSNRTQAVLRFLGRAC
jgi:two-component system NarL family response regulator